MARILIVGGGCRGRRLAAGAIAQGHAVRITTRTGEGRTAIEAAGAECWIGDPDRLATMRGALDGVAILCWLLGSAQGSEQRLAALHSTRLEFFMTQAIDTTVRGVVYESSGTRARTGEVLALGITRRNAIPAVVLDAPLEDAER
ncbi:MAG TPA: hypothetical protein VHT27_06035, partial [Solirubrobacteraceae bacterium]|nr:hypothetical protein [Solirubrobacteraceae bacterium]